MHLKGTGERKLNWSIITFSIFSGRDLPFSFHLPFGTSTPMSAFLIRFLFSLESSPCKMSPAKPPAALSFREFKSSSLWNKTSIPWPGSQGLPIIQAELNLIPVLSIPIITQNYLSANIYSGLIKCMTYKFIYILFLVLKHRQERKIFGSYLQGPHNLVGDIKAYSQR